MAHYDAISDNEYEDFSRQRIEAGVGLLGGTLIEFASSPALKALGTLMVIGATVDFIHNVIIAPGDQDK